MSLKILLDMDGVATNFVRAANIVCGKEPDTIWPKNAFYKEWGISTGKFWGMVDKEGEEFWSEMQPMPWFDDLIRLVERYDSEFYFCTSPSLSKYSCSGKRQWLTNEFGYHFARFILTPGGFKHDGKRFKSKSLLSNPHHILIDDNETNCKDFVDYNGGQSILFPAPYNCNQQFVYNPVLYLEFRLNKIWKSTTKNT